MAVLRSAALCCATILVGCFESGSVTAIDATREPPKFEPPDALAVAATELGDALQVLELTTREEITSHDPDTLVAQLRFMDRLGLGRDRLDEQIQLLARLVKQDSRESGLYHQLAWRYLRANNLYKADFIFRELIDVGYNTVSACEGLAETKRRWDDPEEIDDAWVFCANRAEHPAAKSEYWFRAGVVRRDHGRLPEAIEAFQYAREAGGDSAELAVAVGLTFEIAGDEEAAAEWYGRAIETAASESRLSDAELKTVRLAMRGEDFGFFERRGFERAVLESVPASRAIETLGQIHLMNGDLEGYEQACRRLGSTAAMLRFAKDEWLALRNRVQTRRTLHELDIDESSREADRVAAARLYVAVGEVGRAAHLLSNTSPYDGGETASAWMDVWTARNELDVAEAFIEDIVGRPRMRFTLWELRVRLGMAQGQDPRARRFIKHAAQALYPINPRNGDEWWVQKAILLKFARDLMGDGGDEAFDLWLAGEIESLTQRRPLDAELWDVLAFARRQVGDREGALEAKEVAARLLPHRYAVGDARPERAAPSSSRRNTTQAI